MYSIADGLDQLNSQVNSKDALMSGGRTKRNQSRFGKKFDGDTYDHAVGSLKFERFGRTICAADSSCAGLKPVMVLSSADP
jgi:hypothetical protein